MIERGSRALLFVRAASVALVASSPFAAHAQASSDARASAVELFDAGQKFAARGRWSEACPKFGESFRLDPQLGALLHYGDCLEKEGKLASAYAAFRQSAEMAEKKGDSRQATAEARARKLSPRLDRLTLDVPSAARVDGLEITRDGVDLQEGSWGTALAVDAGEHEVIASAPGHQTWRHTVSIKGEGASETLAVPALDPVPSAAPSAEAMPVTTSSPTPVPAPAEPASSGGGTQRVLGYVAGGLGVVGVGAGVFFTVQMQSKLSERNGICASGVDCAPGTNARLHELTGQARNQGTLAIIGYAAGGAALAGGIALVLTAKHQPSEAGSLRIMPLFVGNGGGLSVAGAL